MKEIFLWALMMVGIASHADDGSMGTVGNPPAGTVTLVGVDGVNAVFKVSGSIPATCKYGTFYIDVQNALGKATYATVLQAYGTGAPVNRIDWNNSAYGAQCFAGLVLLGQ